MLLAEIYSDLTNENNEKFVFGVKDGVRGFYTNPARADDCFIPFSMGTIDFLENRTYLTADSKKTIDLSSYASSDYKTLLVISVGYNSGWYYITGFSGCTGTVLKNISYNNGTTFMSCALVKDLTNTATVTTAYTHNHEIIFGIK